MQCSDIGGSQIKLQARGWPHECHITYLVTVDGINTTSLCSFITDQYSNTIVQCNRLTVQCSIVTVQYNNNVIVLYNNAQLINLIM